MDKKKYLVAFVSFVLIFLFMGMPEMLAQCPMCRMAAESNLENGGTAGKGLNTGILMLLLTPYLLVGTLAFLWYRGRKKSNEDHEAEALDNLLEENAITRS